MSEPHPTPFPTALICDTSFLRTIGGTDSTTYETFVEYVQRTDRELHLSPGVIEELTEQRGYISIDWVDRAATTEWITPVENLGETESEPATYTPADFTDRDSLLFDTGEE